MIISYGCLLLLSQGCVLCSMIISYGCLLLQTQGHGTRHTCEYLPYLCFTHQCPRSDHQTLSKLLVAVAVEELPPDVRAAKQAERCQAGATVSHQPQGGFTDGTAEGDVEVQQCVLAMERQGLHGVGQAGREAREGLKEVMNEFEFD